MAITTFFKDLETIMQEEEVRSGLIRIGIYTAGTAVLASIGAPALAETLDITSIAGIYGANAWAVTQYPYLSPDYVAGHIQTGQEIFGHQAFMRFGAEENGVSASHNGVLQQCRDSVAKVRAITPHEVWLRLLDTAAYALDRIEAAARPVVETLNTVKDSLAERYGATETIIVTTAAVLAAGESIKKHFAAATNFGRKLFGFPEKLSAQDQAILDLSNQMMADMAKNTDEMHDQMEKRVAMMERQIIETLKEQIRNVGPIQVASAPVLTETAITAEDILCANLAASAALVGEDVFEKMEIDRQHAERLSDHSDGIIWISDKIHERMSQVAGDYAGRTFNTKKLCGTLSPDMFDASTLDRRNIIAKSVATTKFLESSLSGTRLDTIRNQARGKADSGKIVADMQGFLRVFDGIPKQARPNIPNGEARLTRVSIEDAAQMPFSVIEGP